MDVWSIDMRAPGWRHCAWETQPETFNRCQFSLLVAHLECILGLWSQCYWELWEDTFTGETIQSLPEVATFWRWTLFKGPQILFSRKINIVPKHVVQGKNTLWSKLSPDLESTSWQEWTESLPIQVLQIFWEQVQSISFEAWTMAAELMMILVVVLFFQKYFLWYRNLSPGRSLVGT